MRKDRSNLIGNKYNKLTILQQDMDVAVSDKVLIKCDCGKSKKIILGNVLGGHSKSCGCTNRGGKVTHGLRYHSLYDKWNSMKSRCYNEKHCSYKYYGARGITVCEEWLDIKNFIDDMYISYKEHRKTHNTVNTSIDRRDNDGNYCKENCRWSTAKEQGNNRRQKTFKS